MLTKCRDKQDKKILKLFLILTQWLQFILFQMCCFRQFSQFSPEFDAISKYFSLFHSKHWFIFKIEIPDPIIVWQETFCLFPLWKRTRIWCGISEMILIIEFLFIKSFLVKQTIRSHPVRAKSTHILVIASRIYSSSMLGRVDMKSLSLREKRRMSSSAWQTPIRKNNVLHVCS